MTDERVLERRAEGLPDQPEGPAGKMRPHRRRLLDLSGAKPSPTLGSAEHVRVGNQVNMTPTSPAMTVSFDQFFQGYLHVGQFQLRYGQIVALAGDLFGIPGKPISDGKTTDERRARFRQVFATFKGANPAEMQRILAVMDAEEKNLTDHMKQGMPANEAAKAHDFDDEYARATGGKDKYDSDSRYIALAKDNYDHFGIDAEHVYIAGHAEAMDAARVAGRAYRQAAGNQAAVDRAWLDFEEALAMNAYADHFLSDLFASGHLRTPRRAAGRQYGETIGALLAFFQHNEDNHFGLFVRNKLGQCWHCYGDNHLDTQQGYENAQRVKAAVQASYNEVWIAFWEDRLPEHWQPLLLIPDLGRISYKAPKGDDGNYINFAAGFIPSQDGKEVKVRTPYDELDKHHWRPTSIVNYHHGPTQSPIAFIEDVLLDCAEQEFWHPARPPRDTMPKPASAPVFYGWSTINRSHAPRGIRTLRYAVAFVGKKVMKDGATAYNCSELGPWSAPIVTRDRECPELRVPGDKSGRAVARILVRWFDGNVPELNAIIVYGNADMAVVVDWNV